MSTLDKAAVLRRLERIAQELRDKRVTPSDTLRRIDALADDLRKDLVALAGDVA